MNLDSVYSVMMVASVFGSIVVNENYQSALGIIIIGLSPGVTV